MLWRSTNSPARRPEGFIEPCLPDARPFGADRMAMGLWNQTRRLSLHLPPRWRPRAGV